MRNPELIGLSSIRWQLFCTFTFKSEKLSDSVRVKMFFSLLRKQAANFGLHFKHMLWCLRSESGEATGRFHYHALIGGLPEHAIHERTCFATMKLWEAFGGGFARVSVYSASLDGADYILKGLTAVESRKSGDFYEFTKFGQASTLTLSESILCVLEGRRSIGQRGRQGQRKGQ